MTTATMPDINAGKGPNILRGVLMLTVLWCAYITFAANWVGGSILAPLIIHSFFGAEHVPPVISQIVNYSITTARIVANLCAAFALMRLGPRKSAILALFLLMFAIVAVWAPNFWLYTGARMIMALGGSMVIVYVNPVMANYIPAKYKITANGFSVVTYNLGAFLVSMAFVFWAPILRANWHMTMTVIAGLTIIFFILYLLVSENFETKKNVSASSTGAAEIKYGYGDAVRDPFVWHFAFGFGVFLFLYVLAVTSMPAALPKYVPPINGHSISGSLINSLVTGFAILGTVLGVWLGLTNWKRKPMMYISGTIAIVAYAYVLYIAPYSHLQAYIFASISGFCMFIHYPIYMNLAHELKDMSAQKLTLVFGFLWGIGYLTYTIMIIIWSLILGSYGWNAASIFFIVIDLTWLYFVFKLPETK